MFGVVFNGKSFVFALITSRLLVLACSSDWYEVHAHCNITKENGAFDCHLDHLYSSSLSIFRDLGQFFMTMIMDGICWCMYLYVSLVLTQMCVQW